MRVSEIYFNLVLKHYFWQSICFLYFKRSWSFNRVDTIWLL